MSVLTQCVQPSSVCRASTVHWTLVLRALWCTGHRTPPARLPTGPTPKTVSPHPSAGSSSSSLLPYATSEETALAFSTLATATSGAAGALTCVGACFCGVLAVAWLSSEWGRFRSTAAVCTKLGSLGLGFGDTFCETPRVAPRAGAGADDRVLFRACANTLRSSLRDSWRMTARAATTRPWSS